MCSWQAIAVSFLAAALGGCASAQRANAPTADTPNLTSAPNHGRGIQLTRVQPELIPPPVTVDDALLPAPDSSKLDGARPIDLATALALTDSQNPQVTLARERIAEADAQLMRAQAMWLPSIRGGVNYNKHEGRIQDVAGNIFPTSRNALYTGLGAGAVGAGSPTVPGLLAQFHLTDAIHQPRIAESEYN